MRRCVSSECGAAQKSSTQSCSSGRFLRLWWVLVKLGERAEEKDDDVRHRSIRSLHPAGAAAAAADDDALPHLEQN